MIDLIIGIVIGLVPAGVILGLAWYLRCELRKTEAALDEANKEGRQLCQKAEDAKNDLGLLRKHLATAVNQREQLRSERDAESERASANSERIQQLQDELDRIKFRRDREVANGMKAGAEARAKLEEIEAIIRGHSCDEDDE